MRNVWLKALKTEADKVRNKSENEEITQFKVKTHYFYNKSPIFFEFLLILLKSQFPKVSSGEGKNPLFKDYDEISRKEKRLRALKAKAEKEEIKKKKKSVNIQKSKLMAPRMETSLMNTPKTDTLPMPKTNPSSFKSNSSAIKEPKKNTGCCQRLLECLGL